MSDQPIPAEVVRADQIQVGDRVKSYNDISLITRIDVIHGCGTRQLYCEEGHYLVKYDDDKVTRIKPAPTLRAEDLPVGTVMVLGKWEYSLWANGPLVYSFIDGKNKNLFWPDELQELIDRGVEFRLPEGGGK